MSGTIVKSERPVEFADSYEEFQRLAEGTNINSRTLLATDYLNHFNEIIMLIEMISDMMECIEDVAAWTPKSYQDHFRDSGFSDRDLAVAAYEYVPAQYRTPFERLIKQLNALVLQVASKLVAASATGDQAEIAAAALFGPELRLLAEKAGAIINGETEATDQADIDAMLDG
ncbi:MAG: hypothetical protein ACOY2B_05975 [Pseudomonadota bacterium]